MEKTINYKPYAVNLVKDFIKSVEGIFVDYNDEKFAVIVPIVKAKRIQRVFGVVNKGKDRVEFHSVVCHKDKANFEKLSEEQRNFTYSKFVKDGDNVMIAASLSMENATYYIVEELIMEVARNADEWEKKLTGKDIF